ncbi:MAG: DAK2 domain-containing protein [Solirubrobacteraceae bacterium]
MANVSLVRFRGAVEGGLGALESRREEINDLNVFPVADGDTGDNMALTLRAVLNELDRLADSGRSLDEIGRDEIVQSVARAALLGARGNSGVILSQLIRGAAEELISRPGELIDPVLVGAAMVRAADQAYGSVREPAEGTILTTVREMALRVVSENAHAEVVRLDGGTTPEVQDRVLAGVIEDAIDAGQESVRRGPDLLPALREAGVVDAGAYGLVVIFSGVVAALRGDEPPEIEHHAAARATQPQHHSSTYRYCINFAVSGSALEPTAHIPGLEALGDSVLVVGDRSTLRVHVHADDPDAATRLFDGVGKVSHVDVADMHEQVERRSERLAAAQPGNGALTAAIAVVSGTGMRDLFEDLGVHALNGGPTLNPSTYDLLAKIHAVPSEQVVLLPSSSNVLMAAEAAAQQSAREVHVVPTRSQQASLAIAFAHDPARPAAANAEAMRRALERVRTGGVAPAARDDPRGRFSAGEAVAFVEEDIVAWGEPRSALAAVLERLGEGAELLTCIASDDAPLGEEAVSALAPAGVEVELSPGGPPTWWWLVAAE